MYVINSTAGASKGDFNQSLHVLIINLRCNIQLKQFVNNNQRLFHNDFGE